MNILLLRNPSHDEFVALPDLLRRLAPPDSDVRVANEPSGFESHLAGESSPVLVVVAQAHPDQYSEADAIRWMALAPLARWICCLGVWCEAVGRTGSPWPPAACVPARNCGDRIRAELRAAAGEVDPLPWTASREEAVAFDAPQSVGTAGGAPAAVCSPDAAIRGVAEAWLTYGGWRVVMVDRDGSGVDDAPEVLLVDADPVDERMERVVQLRAAFPACRLWALMTLARPEDERRLRAAGAERVVAKLSLAGAIASIGTTGCD